MREVVAMVAGWDRAGMMSAEAILVRTQHSSPRQAGARLVVNARGEAGGGVSMGCVESDLRERLGALLADAAMEEGLVHYGAATDGLMEVGLTCGGEIDVWLRRHDAGAAAWRGILGLGAEERAVLCTPLRSGAAQIFAKEGEWSEGVGGRIYLRGVGWIGVGGGVVVGADGTRIFAERIEPAARVVMVGAGPIAEALCDLARRVGYRVVLVDPRRRYARGERYVGAKVVHAWPGEAFTALGVGAGDAVVVLAHDEKLDIPALAAALRAGCGYIGLLGSRRTQGMRMEALGEAGFSVEGGRIHGPIGLDIGAVEPAEIALAVLAEITLCRRGAKRG